MKYPFAFYCMFFSLQILEMHCQWKLKLRSRNTCYCLIEVVTRADLAVQVYLILNFKRFCI